MIFDNLEIINNMKAKSQSAAGREIYNMLFKIEFFNSLFI